MTLLTQDVPRYRVSKQRQSERARVLEFIVITDTHAKSGPPIRQLLGQLYHYAELGGVRYIWGHDPVGAVVNPNPRR